MAHQRVVVMIQENKSTDFYFPTLNLWGADVEDRGNLLKAAPNYDQPHDRNSWVHFKMGDYPAEVAQIDNDVVIPYYSFLAKEFTFCDHHFGVGSNSTPGHMMLVCGQTPTLRNYFTTRRDWDLPTIFTHAEKSGVSWLAFPDQQRYPTSSFTELKQSKKIRTSADFLKLAKQGTLPDLCYVWSPAGYDEHPPRGSNPAYVTNGHNLTWQRVDAVIAGRHWDDTIFILTWDDWGGYADHVQTPGSELVPDQLHPNGFQAIGGSRIPLIMFGGQVDQGIESEWHSHATVVKTVIDVLGLPAFGVPRVDQAPSLASRVRPGLNRPKPPAYGAQVQQPAPPPNPGVNQTHAWKGPINVMMSALVANGGRKIPAPTDGAVYLKPPKLPITGHPFQPAAQDYRYGKAGPAATARSAGGRKPTRAATPAKTRTVSPAGHRTKARQTKGRSQVAAKSRSQPKPASGSRRLR